MPSEIEPCPLCGALPCDWVNDPHKPMTTPTPSEPLELRGSVLRRAKLPLERFADDVANVKSRTILVHQLRTSADIQDGQTKRETGWADTSDRAEHMRVAACAIENLLDRLAKQASTIEALEKGLEQCRAQFQFYANEHRAAGKHDKAATNQYYADLALTTLAAPKENNNDR